MYDELIKRIHQCAVYLPEKLSKNAELLDVLMKAADAIEELSSQLDDFKRMCLPLKENRLYKYSDGNLVEVFLLPSEPPKEE